MFWAEETATVRALSQKKACMFQKQCLMTDARVVGLWMQEVKGSKDWIRQALVGEDLDFEFERKGDGTILEGFKQKSVVI